MTEFKNALLLVGSPKGKNSSSKSLGSYLLTRIAERDILTKTIYLYSALSRKKKEIDFLKEIEEADLIILAAPLYIDTLPAKVIKALALIAKDRADSNKDNINDKEHIYHKDSVNAKKKINEDKIKINDKSQSFNTGKYFLAISNCGFPEAEQNLVAQRVYEEFALSTGFKFLGAIAIGMGGAVSGRSLNELGRMAKNLREGLDQAAVEIMNKEKISQSTLNKIAEPMISPKFLYTLGGNLSWKVQALKNGVYSKLNARPYLEKDS